VKRLLLVTQRALEYGGGGSVRWQYLRDALPRHGWEVEEVSARPNPTANAASTDPRAARLAEARAKVMGAVGTTTRPVYRRLGIQPEAFPPNALWALTGRGAVRRARDRVRPDVVWATCPPPSALFAATAAGDAMPLVAEMRDLWAGNPYFDAGGTLLTRIEKRAFARAASIVTVTQSCADRMLELHPEIAPRLEILPNGFDPDLLALRRRASTSSPRATLVHAGTLYGDRSAVTLMRALSRPELAERTRLVLVGAVDPLTRAALPHARCEVVIEPPVPWRDAVERVRDADIAVVINSPGTGGDMAAPSKLYEALALGTPVLALTNPGTETERLLQRLGHDAGCAPPGDEDAIAHAVCRLLATPPPPVDPAALAPFNRATIAERLATLLNRLST
jgi:glycosyltransferase involved in cell wall biosynthesis